MGYSGFSNESSAPSNDMHGKCYNFFSACFLTFQMLVFILKAGNVIHNIFQSDTYLHPPIHMSFENIREGKDLETSSNLSNI